MPETPHADWIGRVRRVDDEITRPALQRISALLDRDDVFAPRDPIPPHWYAMFFADFAPQSGLGDDGHPRKGDFLPPVHLPRRMFAGRRVRFLEGTLCVGDVATKQSEITAITPKRGRSGEMIFVTLRHSILVGQRLVATEEQDVVYREAPREGTVSSPPTAAPDTDVAWQRRINPSPPLLFRYSAITYNAHRIHYDADYVRDVERYPGLVVNGGLTLLLLLEAAIDAYASMPIGYDVRNVRPLFVNSAMTLSGTPRRGGTARAWAADQDGALAVDASLIFA